MKIFKSDELNLLFRTCIKEGRCLLSASVMGLFSLSGETKPSLLPAGEMWSVAAEVLGEEPLDLGLAKKRGEYLVYGAAYSPRPAKLVQVRIRVGPKIKDLTVSGESFWKPGGMSTSEPVPFTRMEIGWPNTYGGPDFPRNPSGKGRRTNEDGLLPLPNVQNPACPAASPDYAPPPAGLTAYGLMWPQRSRYLGKIGSEYLVRDWPYFPLGTDDEYFNAAPEDQRLDGFFEGNESIEIQNMHPEKMLIQANLPSVRPRLFIKQIRDGEEFFKEIDLKLETVFLFPDRERGIVLYRGLTTTADDDYEDVTHCLAEVEARSEAPLSLEYYFEKFLILLNPDLAPKEDEEEIQEEEEEVEAKETAVSPLAEEKDLPNEPPSAEKKPEDLELDAQLEKLEAIKDEAFEKIRAAGHDPEELMKKLMPPEKEGALSAIDEIELDRCLAELEKQTDALLKNIGITREEALKLAKPPGRPSPTPRQVLDMMRAEGVINPELESGLLELEKIQQEEEAEEAERKKQTGRERLVEDVPEEPAGSTGPVDAAEALAWHQEGKSLAGYDLTGFDFSGMKLAGADFSRAVLEKAIFKQAALVGADFTRAVAIEADFTEADLKASCLADVTAEKASFIEVDLREAILESGDFTKADFTGANLTLVKASNAVFEEAIMTGIVARELKGANAAFDSARLTDADFSRADLTGAFFYQADIAGANLNGAVAEGLRLEGARGEKANFQAARLGRSRADQGTRLSQAVFKEADLSRALWAGAVLPEADLSAAVLVQADFSRADLSAARLNRVNAKQTNFMKADLRGVSANKVNLFKGDLRKADISGADFSGSNLYGVDLYKLKMGNAIMSGVNLKNTLLALKP